MSMIKINFERQESTLRPWGYFANCLTRSRTGSWFLSVKTTWRFPSKTTKHSLVYCTLMDTLFLFWTCKPVLRCRLSRGALSSGKPQGVGISEWGGMETWRSVYKQPGTRVDGSYHSKEGAK